MRSPLPALLALALTLAGPAGAKDAFDSAERLRAGLRFAPSPTPKPVAAELCKDPHAAVCGPLASAPGAQAAVASAMGAGLDPTAEEFLAARCAPAAAVSQLSPSARTTLLGALGFEFAPAFVGEGADRFSPELIDEGAAAKLPGQLDADADVKATEERFARYKSALESWESSLLADAWGQEQVASARALVPGLKLRPSSFAFSLPSETLAASKAACLAEFQAGSPALRERVCSLKAAHGLTTACATGALNAVSGARGPTLCPSLVAFASWANRAPATQDPWATFIGIVGHEHGHQVETVNAGGETSCDKHGGGVLAEAAALRYAAEVTKLKEDFAARAALKTGAKNAKAAAALSQADADVSNQTEALRLKLLSSLADALRPYCGLGLMAEAKKTAAAGVPAGLSCRRSALEEPREAAGWVAERAASDEYLNTLAYEGPAVRFKALLQGYAARLPKLLGTPAGVVPLALCPAR